MTITNVNDTLGFTGKHCCGSTILYTVNKIIFLNRGFDNALTELVVNDGGILGRNGDVYEGGGRICIL